MTRYFIVPGLGNSGPQHWQTYFENSGTGFTRIQQQEWDAPTCEDWISTIEKYLEGEDLPNVVLIGHSLGSAAIVHWASKYKHIIKAAMLVAPSDPEAPHYTFPATGFAPLPLHPLPFSSVVVASADDVWVSLERATLFANSWGSKLVNLGNAGHINAASGHGEWVEGLEILKGLA
jgi:predicted alpha/beta hydrolase family esterase